MSLQKTDHTFAICAYKESVYLDDCIQSLLHQSVKSNIIICTSTPNDYIKNKAKKYNIPLYINDGKSGLSSDWNFAASCVTTKYYTLCHQDDCYLEEYIKVVLEKTSNAKDCIFVYTNYYEDKKGIIVKNNVNLKIKRLMNFPMQISVFQKNKFIRRRILSLGNSICCPSVTFNKDIVRDDLFDSSFKNAADWDAWERLSKVDGKIVYCKNYLMTHRVHDESTTSLNIQNNIRRDEDLIMFKRFWPYFIAKPLAKLFGISEKNNG